MPTENETKPCSRPGCNGRMTFKRRGKPPGWISGTIRSLLALFGVAMPSGAVITPPREMGWQCAANRDHFERVPKETR